MMQLVRFFGGIPFAIILIATTALFVAVGTILESITDSHRYAALLTYDSPVFSLLLGGFFLNILVSALRRWPFRLKHIPFLITHLGLLMILGGILLKNAYGIQGSLHLIEGSGSDEIFIPNSYALYIQDKENKTYYPIKHPFVHHSIIKKGTPDNPLEVTLIDSTPHSIETIDTWFKGNKLIIAGLPPIEVQTFPSRTSKARLHQFSEQSPSWLISGFDCEDPEACAKQLYITNTTVEIIERSNGKVILNAALEDLLNKTIKTSIGDINTHLHFNWMPISGFQKPYIDISINNGTFSQNITIELDGEQAILNKQTSTNYAKKNFAIDLHRPSELIFLRDALDETYMFAFNNDGRFHCEAFRQGNLKSIVAYNDGFSGYAVNASLPFTIKADRAYREKEQREFLAEELQKRASNPNNFTPALQMLLHATKQSNNDFAAVTIAFLEQWRMNGGWLYNSKTLSPSLTSTMNALDWNSQPDEIRLGSLWTSVLFEKIDPLLAEGKAPEDIVELIQWPIPIQSPNLLEEITWQIYSASHELPTLDTKLSPNIHARMLSAYLRAWEIDPNNIFESDFPTNTDNPIRLECPLSCSQKYAVPLKKLENNQPCLRLRCKNGIQQQLMTLTYDRFGTKLKWPLLQDKYLIRFQQLCRKIPYRLRLRQARQINYAGSNQPYSYECDLIIKDADGAEIEKTISMNDVHETWEGYRFYLSSVHPPSPGEIKRVQIVVNYDPAKYLLTYPGAIILSLGIILLFLKRKQKKKNSN